MNHSSALVLLLAKALIGVATLTAAEDRPLTRIALGSCARQNQPQPIWDPIVAAKPDLFLFLGDNIYGDSRDMNVLRDKYAQLAAKPGFQKLRATCPILAIWDDHDYGADDAGAEYPMKVESQKLFLDFFNEPADSPRRQREGVYDAKLFGPVGNRVQVILLDTRYFRGPLKPKPRVPGKGTRYLPNPDTSVTMLGDTQWKWLEEQLRVPAEVRIIASSIQVVSEEHDSEKWMNLPHERERLYRLIRDTRAAGVLFVSGDVHRGEISAMDGGVGYPLYDLTSSGLTHTTKVKFTDWPNRYRIGTVDWTTSFGVIEFDWNRQVPLIRLQIRDDAGELCLQKKVALDELRPPLKVRESESGGRAGEAKSDPASDAKTGSVNKASPATSSGPKFRVHEIGRPTGNGFGQTSAVDVDKDGDLDFISGRQFGDVFWFENHGNGRWIQHVIGHKAKTDVGGVAFDVDGDGWVDQVSGGTWFRNPGNPREAAEWERFENGTTPTHDNLAADIDGDGKLDLVSILDKVGVFWYRIPDDPKKHWIEHKVLGVTEPQCHGGIATGDIDGDGEIDILTKPWRGDLHLFVEICSLSVPLHHNNLRRRRTDT